MDADAAVDDAAPLRGRRVLLAGGTSTAGWTVARRLLAADAHVIIVGHDPARLAEVRAEIDGVFVETADLEDEAEVEALADRVHAEHGALDGVFHLVGGWRGGGGLAGQSDDDFRFLERSLTALRHVSRVFDADLRASAAGRLAIVSSTAVTRPTAGGANYAAVKAAAEAWTRAVGQGFAKAARDAGSAQTAAAVIFRVRSLAGLEDALADAFVALWDDEAEAWHDALIEIVPAD
jgi:NAD(P)-dependent dehydrogenase (short-subunit alcohol dehydrogenase family)